MRRPPHTVVVAATVLCAGAPLCAAAQTARSGGQNAQATQQLQQLASERSALQAENTRLKQERDDLQKKLDAASAQGSALAKRAQTAEAASSRLAASNAASVEGAARSKTQMDELVGKFRETAQTLKTIEAERNALRQQVQTAERQITSCREDNAQLLSINKEVLVRLENTGFWSKLAASEPFTRLKRTQLENLAEEYRARATDLAEPPPPAQ